MNDFLEYPKYFVSEYLNRWWVLILLVVIVFYFVYLRKFYIRRETFKNVTNKLSKGKNQQNQNHQKNNKIIEKFETSPIPEPNVISSTSIQDTATIDYTEISVTENLFTNLQLSPTQMDTAILFYKQTISQVLDKLIKLTKQIKINQYIRADKQYSKIITDGVDGIMNLLTNTIKSQYTITRTSIKTDLIQTLQFNITKQIDRINNQLINEMNNLAQMNSTTIDYNKELQTIDKLRTKANDLNEADDLINTYGNTSSHKISQINKALNKSDLLPIYEKNIDRLNQMINADYNGNEERLTDKYGKLYTEYLAEEQKQNLDINPLRLASQIESGAINILSNIFSSKQENAILSPANVVSSKNLVEQYGYIDDKLSHSRNNIVPEQEPLPSNIGVLNPENIFNDAGNRANYLIDNKTRKTLIEGFETKAATNNGSIVSEIAAGVGNVAASLTGTTSTGDGENPIYKFIYYALDMINGKIGFLWGMYQKKYGGNYEVFNLEDNMVPLGFLLFVLSMLFYFIDLTS